MAPDLLFDFAVTFTVSPRDPWRGTLESAMADLFRSYLDARWLWSWITMYLSIRGPVQEERASTLVLEFVTATLW